MGLGLYGCSQTFKKPKLNNYDLEKWIWTESDFEDMGWHDCVIYAMKFDDDVLFDLDYILKWNDPEVGGMSYTFWISPATLIFKDVGFLKVDFKMDFANGLEIYQLSKTELDKTTEWKVETQEGDITLHSQSFQQVILRKPTLQFGQYIPNDERATIPFSDIPKKDFIHSDLILKKRKTEFGFYEMAKERVTYRIQLENLSRNGNDAKKYLTIKRRLKERIIEITQKLNGTRFERS